MKTPRGYLTHPKRHSSVMTPLPRASKRLKQKSSPDSEASFLSSPAAKVPMPTSHKSYTCSSCPQIFKEKSHLEEHRKALHPPAAAHTSIASEPTPLGRQSIALPGLSRVNKSPGPPGPPRVNSSSSSNPNLTIRDEMISTIVAPPVLNTTPEEEDVTVEELDDMSEGLSAVDNHGTEILSPSNNQSLSTSAPVFLPGTHLKNHVESTHEGIHYSCNQCEYKATTTGSLKKHVESTHEGVRYPCDQCDFIGNEAINLIDHTMAVHKLQDLLTCKFCQLFMPNSNTLQDHISATHSNTSDNPSSVSIEQLVQKFQKMEQTLVNQTSLLSDIESSMRKGQATTNRMMNDNDAMIRNLVERQSQLEYFTGKLENSANSLSPPTKTAQLPVPPSKPSSPELSSNDLSNTLYLGDSIGHNVDFNTLESNLNSKIDRVKAYTAVKGGRFPESNLNDVARTKLSEGKKFKNLITQVGSVDITNIDTNTNPDLISNLESYKQTASISSQNIVTIAEKAVENHPTLENVIIMERTERCDKKDADPCSCLLYTSDAADE